MPSEEPYQARAGASVSSTTGPVNRSIVRCGMATRGAVGPRRPSTGPAFPDRGEPGCRCSRVPRQDGQHLAHGRFFALPVSAAAMGYPQIHLKVRRSVTSKVPPVDTATKEPLCGIPIRSASHFGHDGMISQPAADTSGQSRHVLLAADRAMSERLGPARSTAGLTQLSCDAQSITPSCSRPRRSPKPSDS